MATVSERSRELLEKQRLSVTHNLAWLEQALLAERRLARIGAFEESAKIARLYQTAVAPTTNAAERIEYLILERAAAEKEVGK